MNKYLYIKYNYINRQGFCCGDTGIAGKANGTVGTSGNITGGNDNPEIYQYYYHSDHLGSSSFITNLDGEVAQHIEYVPFGEVFLEERDTMWNSPYKFNGKELDEEIGLYYYGARYYNPRTSLWLSVDPMQEKYHGISPYCYTLNNPVKLVDPNGMSAKNPVYDKEGNFLGIDDKGLKGDKIVMAKEHFTQGMSHEEAMSYNLSPNLGFMKKEDREKMESHFNSLKYRPDYDGFVTISEGIAWAKSHEGALQYPTPDNTLYIDASKLDFGNTSITDFSKGINVSTSVNLFNVGNFISSAGNSNLRSTVYALGRVHMILLDKNWISGAHVKIVNDQATDYDWNRGGNFWRSHFIDAERYRAGLTDADGFKAFYYGTGKLNPEINIDALK